MSEKNLPPVPERKPVKTAPRPKHTVITETKTINDYTIKRSTILKVGIAIVAVAGLMYGYNYGTDYTATHSSPSVGLVGDIEKGAPIESNISAPLKGMTIAVEIIPAVEVVIAYCAVGAFVVALMSSILHIMLSGPFGRPRG